MILGGVGFVVFIAAQGAAFLFLGDSPPAPGLPIDNRTNKELVIYGVTKGTNSRDEQEVAVAEVAPLTTKDSGIGCAMGELVARTCSGTEIARRQRQ